MKITKIVSHSSDGSMLTLYLEHECSKVIVERKEKQISNDGDIAFVNKFEDGSYTFGIIQGDYRADGHSKGYIWSSRASVINSIFNLNIMEVAVKLPEYEEYFSRAFDIDALEKVLPKDWKIIKKKYSDGEVYPALKYIGKTFIRFNCGDRVYSNEGSSNDNLHLNTIFQKDEW